MTLGNSIVILALALYVNTSSASILYHDDLIDEDVICITIPSLLITTAAIVIQQTTSSPTVMLGARVVMAIGYAGCSIVPLWRMMQSSPYRDWGVEKSAL